MSAGTALSEIDSSDRSCRPAPLPAGHDGEATADRSVAVAIDTTWAVLALLHVRRAGAASRDEVTAAEATGLAGTAFTRLLRRCVGNRFGRSVWLPLLDRALAQAPGAVLCLAAAFVPNRCAVAAVKHGQAHRPIRSNSP